MIFTTTNKLNDIKKSTSKRYYITNKAISGEALNTVKGLPVEISTSITNIITPYVNDVVLICLVYGEQKAIVELYQSNIRVMGMRYFPALKQNYHQKGLKVIFDDCKLPKAWDFSFIIHKPTITDLINSRICHILLQSNVPDKFCRNRGPEIDGLSTYVPDYVFIFKG